MADTNNTPGVASPVEATISDRTGIASTGKAAAHKFYQHMNCLLTALGLSCHGMLKINGSPLFDETTAPWKSMKVSWYHPNANEFKGEIEHRWNVFASAGQIAVPPHPKQWSLPKVLRWLNKNPITDDGDIAFFCGNNQHAKADS